MPEVSCLSPDCKNLELLCFGINYSCGTINLPKFHEFFISFACKSITEASTDGITKVVQ